MYTGVLTPRMEGSSKAVALNFAYLVGSVQEVLKILTPGFHFRDQYELA